MHLFRSGGLMKKPSFSKLEEYVFGAAAVAEEIKKRKKSGKRVGFVKTVSAYALLAYLFVAGSVMCLVYLIWQGLYKVFKTK